jgi:hypothetical protein
MLYSIHAGFSLLQTASITTKNMGEHLLGIVKGMAATYWTTSRNGAESASARHCPSVRKTN